MTGQVVYVPSAAEHAALVEAQNEDPLGRPWSDVHQELWPEA